MVWNLVPHTSIRGLEGHFVTTLPRNARKMWWKLLGLCVHVHNCYKQCPTKLSKRPTKIVFVRTCVHAKPNSYFQHWKVKSLVIFKSLQHNRTKLKLDNLVDKMSVGDLERNLYIHSLFSMLG